MGRQNDFSTKSILSTRALRHTPRHRHRRRIGSPDRGLEPRRWPSGSQDGSALRSSGGTTAVTQPVGELVRGFHWLARSPARAASAVSITLRRRVSSRFAWATHSRIPRLANVEMSPTSLGRPDVRSRLARGRRGPRGLLPRRVASTIHRALPGRQLRGRRRRGGPPAPAARPVPCWVATTRFRAYVARTTASSDRRPASPVWSRSTRSRALPRRTARTRCAAGPLMPSTTPARNPARCGDVSQAIPARPPSSRRAGPLVRRAPRIVG